MLKRLIFFHCCFLLFILSDANAQMAGAVKGVKPPVQTIIIDAGHGGMDVGAQGSETTEAAITLGISLKLRDLVKDQIPELKVLMTREKDELPGGLHDKNAALKWRANFANENKGDLFVCIHVDALAARYERRQVGTRTETRSYFTGKGKKRKKVSREVDVPIYKSFKLPNTKTGSSTWIVAANAYDNKTKAVGNMSELYEGVDLSGADSTQPLIDPIEAKIRVQQYTKYFFTKSLTFAEMVQEELQKAGRINRGVAQRDWERIWVLQATQMPSVLIENGFIDNPDDEAFLMSDDGQTKVAQAITNAIKRYKLQLETAQKHAQDAKNNLQSTPK